MAFIDLMKEKAKQDVMTIILPESNDKRTLIAAAQVLKEKTADLIMIGKRSEIRPLCRDTVQIKREKGHDSRESTGDLKDRLHHIRRYDGKRKRR